MSVTVVISALLGLSLSSPFKTLFVYITTCSCTWANSVAHAKTAPVRVLAVCMQVKINLLFVQSKIS